jgi:hypothetical protein
VGLHTPTSNQKLIKTTLSKSLHCKYKKLTLKLVQLKEDYYIEFTLLLHCKLEIKKNARVIDFSGVFEFLYGYLGDYILIH